MNYQLRSHRDKSLSITEQIFLNRGLTDVNHYLNTTREDVLPPETIDRIREGATMLVKAIQQSKPTFIQIDSDCDGYTSAALLINYLNRIAPYFVSNYLSYSVQDGKEHGIFLDKIPLNTKLVIAPDSSSNDYEEHKILKEKGIDILVIDHHEAEKVSEYACVINNQLCNYPTKSLSGVGMVYKFCSYIDQLLKQNIADDYLDLVAVGMVGDMMDMRDFETKYLISSGLANIRNPHIKARCAANEYSIGTELTPFGISFYVAPFINAINRSGTYEEKMLVFESMLEFKAYDQIPSTKRGCKGQFETRVEQAIRTSNNVKSRQDKTVEANVKIVENLITIQNALNNSILVITIPKDQAIDTNLTGLIANQMTNKYMRPTLLLNHTEHDGELYWEGSGRNFANSPLTHFRQFLLDTRLFEYAEGHESAFGAGIKQNNLSAFLQQSNERLSDFDFSATYLVDFEFQSYDALNLRNAVLDIGSLKRHWGQGLEEPLILVKNINITKDNLTLYEKGPTLKIALPGDEGIELMKFRSSEDEYNSLYTESGCVKINIIGACDINSWHGNLKPQITIKDYEIIGKEAYYF